MKSYQLTAIQAPVGAIYTYCYLLETAHFVFLIDSAVASSQALVEEQLEKADPAKRLIILNTHGHWDHTGLNGYLQRTRGALVGAHLYARKWMSDKDFHFTTLYTSLLSQFPYTEEKKELFYRECGEPALQNLCFAGGEIFEDDGFELHVIHTPGHSNDSVCYYEKNSRALFCGDSLQGYGVLGNLPFYCDAALYRKTVETMACCDAANVYGGHCIREGESEAEAFLRECVDGFWQNDWVLREVLEGRDRSKLTLTELAEEVAARLRVINNIQPITTVRAQLKFIEDEY